MIDRAISELNELYDALKEKVINSGVSYVIEISGSEILLGIEERLRKYGVEFEFVVKTNIEESMAAEYIPNSDEGANGSTSFYSRNGIIESIIFIVSSGENEINNALTKYAALAHEFGHFSDFSKRINYHESGVCKNLVKAEAFADVFALKHFHNESNFIAAWVKAEYSKIILERKNKNSFTRLVHKEIIGHISESRLKNWKKVI